MPNRKRGPKRVAAAEIALLAACRREAYARARGDEAERITAVVERETKQEALLRLLEANSSGAAA